MKLTVGNIIGVIVLIIFLIFCLTPLVIDLLNHFRGN